MDLTQRHRVCELVQQLTQAGRAVPEPLLLDELKLLCRGSDAALRAAFAQVPMTQTSALSQWWCYTA